jgi:DNA-binding MarR family transcriptional regulator
MNNISNGNSRERDMIFMLVSFAIKHRKVMQSLLDKTGVYQAQHFLLMAISSNQYASQKELADSLEISTATVAVSLKKLENGGYIKKVMDKDDNRLNKIVITEKGNKVVEQSREIFKYRNERIFRGFTDSEMDTLSKLVKRLNQNLADMEEEIKRQ